MLLESLFLNSVLGFLANDFPLKKWIYSKAREHRLGCIISPPAGVTPKTGRLGQGRASALTPGLAVHVYTLCTSGKKQKDAGAQR